MRESIITDFKLFLCGEGTCAWTNKHLHWQIQATFYLWPLSLMAAVAQKEEQSPTNQWLDSSFPVPRVEASLGKMLNPMLPTDASIGVWMRRKHYRVKQRTHMVVSVGLLVAFSTGKGLFPPLVTDFRNSFIYQLATLEMATHIHI